MTIRGILFDKDGTLLDFQKTWVPINREVALFAAGGNLPLAARLLALGGQDPVTGIMTPGSVLAAGTHLEISEVFADALGAATPKGLVREIETIFREGGAKYAELIDGVDEALAALRGDGYILGVATNDTAEGLMASLGRHTGLLDRFLFTAGCDSGFGSKPEPGMALAFCLASALEPSEVAIIGDAVHDLDMGRRARLGLRIGVLGGTGDYRSLAAAADVVLSGVAALPDWLTTQAK